MPELFKNYLRERIQMGGMKKLLAKPLKAFTWYALIVLACSIPAYFYIIDSIWLSEISEHNLLVSDATKRNLKSLRLTDKQLDESVDLWNRLQPETKLQQVEQVLPDSTYNIYKANPHANGDINRFQGLVTYFKLNNKSFSLTVETNLEESYETIGAITAVAVLFFVILLLGFVTLNKRISQRLWQPFYDSLAKIKKFDLNDQEIPKFPKTEIAEFEEMNASIGQLIDGNVAAFRQQKEFIENASHELQTPLAIIQSKMDMLLQSSTLSDEQSDIISDTNKALARVSRINKNLLLLAKLENHQFPEMNSLRLSETLTEISDLLADFASGKNVHIKREIHSEVVIEGNRTLVEIMLTNLILNAVRHNISGGDVSISLAGPLLTISNPGERALDEEKVFQRFSSASFETPGSGLGLAIVREICNRYGWSLNYQHSSAIHTFSILFR